MTRSAQYLVTVEYEGFSDRLAGFEIQHAIDRSPDLFVRKLERVVGVVEVIAKDQGELREVLKEDNR